MYVRVKPFLVFLVLGCTRGDDPRRGEGTFGRGRETDPATEKEQNKKTKNRGVLGERARRGAPPLEIKKRSLVERLLFIKRRAEVTPPKLLSNINVSGSSTEPPLL